MSLAAETRRAADGHPFLRTALRAGIVNYTAAARFLEIDGEVDAVATALRRYAEELPAYERDARDVRVRMESGIGSVDAGSDDALIAVGGESFGPSGGDRTAIVATGDTDAAALAAVLQGLNLEAITPTVAAVGGDSMVVVVDRLEGADALRAIEGALEAVPSSGE
ncbi:DUF7523 family protein [Natronorubrum sp. DTA28]|uniref:DUF7523 family protein n=1 Tax=Natronorubrum sp. DTA28 TaxID=3447019 RepID=UPI003F825536